MIIKMILNQMSLLNPSDDQGRMARRKSETVVSKKESDKYKNQEKNKKKTTREQEASLGKYLDVKPRRQRRLSVPSLMVPEEEKVAKLGVSAGEIESISC